MTDALTVITGGGRGIGAAVAMRLAADGHDLVLGYASDEAAARRTADRVTDLGVRCRAVRGDVADPVELDALFDAAGELGTLTVGLAQEVADRGIRVNAVAPGIVRTDIHSDAGDPGRLDRLGPAVPVGRAGEPEEVAEAVAWLMSDACPYATGAVLRVAGGR